MVERIETGDLIAAVVDEGSWRPWDAPVIDPGVDDSYDGQLAAAREESGADESVVSGSARVEGIAVAVVAGDFRFLAGSVGRSAAHRIVAAVERATALGLPLLGMPTSGGTRMQEGAPAFLLMAGVAAAVRRHLDAGLPYLTFLRHPTTGGVLATWGSLGDLAHAQPGALVGFLGPRVYEGLYGRPFPEGVQTAEGLVAAGVIDGVADPSQWRIIVAEALAAYRARPEEGPEVLAWESAGGGSGTGVSAGSRLHPPARVGGWEAVTATRHPGRPGLTQLLEHVTGFVAIGGTRAGEAAAATCAGVGRIDGIGCVLVGYDRAAQARGDLIGPADLRLARRAMALAQRWHLPLVTVVDTQGGELSASAERGALAAEIARCLSDMSCLATPTLSVLLGGGAGGVALALLPADRVLAAADGWITPLPPEGASLIRYRTADRAREMADSQRITAADLARIGAVDRIVDPPAGDLGVFAAAVGEELSSLAARPLDIGARAGRWAGLEF